MSEQVSKRRLSSFISIALSASVLIAMANGIASSQTQQKKGAGTKQSSPPKVDVLNNEAVVKMVTAGLDETLINAKIRSTEKTEFQLDTDSIIALKSKNVPASVMRTMMEKSGIAVSSTDARPAESAKTPATAPLNGTALGGTWSGQMTLENEPTTIRLVLQKSAFGSYSGGIAFQAQSGTTNMGRIEVRDGAQGVVLSAMADAGAQVEFSPNSLSATAISGEVQVKAMGANGVRKGTFSLVKESDREDLSELSKLQSKMGTVVAKQGDAQLILPPRPQQHAFAQSKAADAKSAAKDIALNQAGTTMAVHAGSALAAAGGLASHFALPVAVLSMLPVFHFGSKETVGFEFEFLRGAKAVTEIREGPLEIVLPINQYLPSDANITDIRPVLVRLDVIEKDSVRLVSSRKVSYKPKKQGKFDTHPTLERTEQSVEQNVVEADFDKGPNNTFILRPKAPLSGGEYSVGIFTKAASGTYTENVPLKGPWSAEEMARFMAKGEEWTGYGAIAWDFRVVK